MFLLLSLPLHPFDLLPPSLSPFLSLPLFQSFSFSVSPSSPPVVVRVAGCDRSELCSHLSLRWDRKEFFLLMPPPPSPLLLGSHCFSPFGFCPPLCSHLFTKRKWETPRTSLQGRGVLSQNVRCCAVIQPGASDAEALCCQAAQQGHCLTLTFWLRSHKPRRRHSLYMAGFKNFTSKTRNKQDTV